MVGSDPARIREILREMIPEMLYSQNIDEPEVHRYSSRSYFVTSQTYQEREELALKLIRLFRYNPDFRRLMLAYEDRRQTVLERIRSWREVFSNPELHRLMSEVEQDILSN
jgi:hypothetical protein